MHAIRFVFPVLAFLLLAPELSAQAAPPESALNVFYDCLGSGCDFDFMRREIPVVNWVRDREVADVHVLITSQLTGSGGRTATLAFIGLGELEGEDQTLTASWSGDATLDEQRRTMAERLKIGLVRYLAETSAADLIQVSIGQTVGAGAGGAAAAAAGGLPAAVGLAGAQVEDPWNSWVFNVGFNGFASGESSSSRGSYSGSLSANRTTYEWKTTLSARYSYSSSKFDLGDDRTVESRIEDWSVSGLIVKSLTPHWSVGGRYGTGRSTRLNEDFRWNLSPGIEYNFFPWSESSRRSLTLQALLHVRHWDYTEETIYEKTDETLLATSATAALNRIEPWGRTILSFTASRYTHDSDLYRLSLNGSVQVRVFRGFSVNMSGGYSWVRDQLSPRAGDLTTEEILLRQRQQQTRFTYFTSFGVTYRFGSIFNNVVNPRF